MEQNDLLSTLKWKELTEVEEYLGLPMDEWQEAKSKSKLAFVMQYILAKRTNPDLTIEAAGDLSIAALTELSGVEIKDPKGEVNQA